MLYLNAWIPHPPSRHSTSLLMNYLTDRFYPFKTISTSSRDTPFITPEIKYLLRCKNKLQRSGNLEAAACLATRISRKIAPNNASSFSKPCTGRKDLWERVNERTGRNKTSNTAEQYDAELCFISQLKCIGLPDSFAMK